MNELRDIRIDDYSYELPADQIAEAPVPDRSRSRLLRYAIPEDRITHHRFGDLPELLPAGSTIILNDTRVVPARLICHRHSGGRVEIFLLAPIAPSNDPAVVLASSAPVTWHALARGMKRLRIGEVLAVGGDGPEADSRLTAEILEKGEGGIRVRFSWETEGTFAEVIDRLGRIPLPPYITREEREEDREDYQTVYAATPGAVAAPTAGLHFTPSLLESIEEDGHAIERVTLHVGAGTFAPVKVERAGDHPMHVEQFSVSRDTVEALAVALREDRTSSVVHVGTTTLRTIESLYWLAEQRLGGRLDPEETPCLEQWYAAERRADGAPLPSASAAFASLALQMHEAGIERIVGETALMILPGYHFMTCDRLITNFHQPGSTLILLVAAFLGRQRWRELYEVALAEGYRFLSFGDASLLERR